MRDDLVRPLALEIDRALAVDDPYPSPGRLRTAFAAARAVLACELVVPTSDVLNLAQQWNDSDRRRGWGWAYAAELRALTQQEAR